MSPMDRYTVMPPIDYALPIAFQNKSAHVDNFRGEVICLEPMVAYRVKSISYCGSCKVLYFGNFLVQMKGALFDWDVPKGENMENTISTAVSPWIEDRIEHRT